MRARVPPVAGIVPTVVLGGVNVPILRFHDAAHATTRCGPASGAPATHTPARCSCPWSPCGRSTQAGVRALADFCGSHPTLVRLTNVPLG
jgi:hypothetical protein